ncbi:MAG: hypothetical protein RL748_1968 [Pseudomonadota bacterium]
MKKQSIVALFAVGAAFASNMALADTININQIFDLTAPDTQTASRFDISSDNFAPVLIHVGDIVNLNYSFSPNQALQVSSTGDTQFFSIGLWQDTNSSPNFGPFSIDNASFALTGAHGSFPSSIPVAAQSGASTNLAATLTGSFLPNGGTVNFTGMQATFTVTALQDNQTYFNASYFKVTGNAVAVTTPVPEPETYAMMIAGLGALAFVARRKQAKKLG